MNDYVVMIHLCRNHQQGNVRYTSPKKKNRSDGCLKKLNEVIPPPQHKKFQKRFFRGRAKYYRKLLHLINSLPTWEKAADFINLLYNKEVIDPYSKEAIEFNNLVYRRYFPE